MKFTHSNSIWQRLQLWLLKSGWRFIAYWIVEQAVRLDHTDSEAFCWPCEAIARIKRDRHEVAVGARAVIYCPKCGLDKRFWRAWCSNRVEQVNYREPKEQRSFIKIGWD